MVDNQDQFEAPAPAPRRAGRRLLMALVLLLLVVGGVLAAAWQFPAAQRQILGLFGLEPRTTQLANLPPAQPKALSAPAALPSATPMATPPAPGMIDTRIALLEERLARLDLEAQAASGNAARAEGLLIAFAARRALDRGAPLGFLEDQLRLRFADAQPNAVETLIVSAARPVTLDGLYAELDRLAPQLTGTAPAGDNWGWIKQEFASLFIIRHQSGSPMRSEDRLARAKLLLAAGKTGEAIGEVERLPGAKAASAWIGSARRYDSVQRALDLVETTALLDSNRLRDAGGAKVEQPSPLAGPAL